MKILLVGAHSNAPQEFTAGLSARGFAVISASNAQQAEQMLPLHAASLDIAIVFREGKDPKDLSAMNFVNFFKKNQEYSDIPYVLLSKNWTQADFAKHQATPFGANAYLKWPTSAESVIQILEQVLGELPEVEEELSDINIGSPMAPPDPTHMTKAPKPPPIPTSHTRSGMPPKPPKQPTKIEIPNLEISDSSTFESPVDQEKGMTLESPFPEEPAEGEDLPSIQLNVDESGEPKENTRIKTQHIDASKIQKVKKPAKEQKIPARPTGQNPISLDIEEGSIPDLEQQKTRTLAKKAIEAKAEDDAKKDSEPSESKMDPSLERQLDEDVQDEMPYLFGDKNQKKEEHFHVPIGRPTGDALIPGGISQSPDVETLKKYLELREQDVGILSGQVRVYKEQIKNLEDELRSERKRGADLEFQHKSDRERLEEIERDEKRGENSLKKELKEVRFKLRSKSDKVKVLEEKVQEATEEVERIKERVRADIRKIRTREKELENKLELLKKDSEVLLKARENRIVDLKRKLDMSEFNIDLLQDQYQREKENSRRIQERLDKASQAMRVAGGFLDHNEENEEGDDFDTEGSQAS